MESPQTYPTLAGDWDRFYREYPHIYDRFALSSVQAIRSLSQRFAFKDRVIADIGAGTGRSAFELARQARLVLAVEPWASMRGFAVRRTRAAGVRNVAFIAGTAEDLPFRAGSLDCLVSVYGFPFWFAQAGPHGEQLAKRFVSRGQAALKPGGSMLIVNSALGWDAGELTGMLWPAGDRPDGARRDDQLMTGMLGFQFDDVVVTVDYGSVEEAVATFGFIFGHTAIDYLLTHQISQIRWKLRLYHSPGA